MVSDIATLVPLFTYDVQFAIPVNLAIGTALPRTDPAVQIETDGQKSIHTESRSRAMCVPGRPVSQMRMPRNRDATGT
jgi:hypothetical protein